MTSKERVLTAFSNQEPDRVPIDYLANPGIDRRLKSYFGLREDNDEGLLQALGVDFRGVSAPYCGTKLHQDIPERGVKVDNWGKHRRWIEHESGGYWDYCDFPLQNASEDEVDRWPMPSPDDYDYSSIRERCREKQEYAVFAGGAGLPDVINGNGMLRGMEQTLVDLITNDPRDFCWPIVGPKLILKLYVGCLKPQKAALIFCGWGKTWALRFPPLSAWISTAGKSGRCIRNALIWRGVLIYRS